MSAARLLPSILKSTIITYFPPIPGLKFTSSLRRLVRECHLQGDERRIGQIVDQLIDMFSSITNALHVRNGGLIGLAGTAIALGVDIAPYMERFLEPLLICFSDPENRVRYFAAECLYNISKVSKGEVLVYFNPIFDALSKVRRVFFPYLQRSPAPSSPLILNFPSRTGQNFWIAYLKTLLPNQLLIMFPIFWRQRNIAPLIAKMGSSFLTLMTTARASCRPARSPFPASFPLHPTPL